MTVTPKLAFVTIVATLAYLGLAILDWHWATLARSRKQPLWRRPTTRQDRERGKDFAPAIETLIPRKT
jgi:hypothetical protein